MKKLLSDRLRTLSDALSAGRCVVPVILLCAALFFSSRHLDAQTIIGGGPVSGVWDVSGSPYYITGDVEVPDDSLLRITAGVTVRISEGADFVIKGSLVAAGESGALVSFKPLNSSFGRGLQFIGADTSLLLYCSFNGFNNVFPDSNNDYKGSALISQNSHLLIFNSLFDHNKINHSNIWLHSAKGGAAYFSASKVFIDNSSFAFNDIEFNDGPKNPNISCFGGAVCIEGSMGFVKNSTFAQNSISIEGDGEDQSVYVRGGGIYTTGSIKILSSTISNNHCYGKAVAWFYGGGWVLALSYVEGGGVYGSNVKNCDIYGNTCVARATGGGKDGGSGSSTSSGGGLYGGGSGNRIYGNSLNSNATGTVGGAGKCMGGGLSGTGINNLVYGNASSAWGNSNFEGKCQGGGINGGGMNNVVMSNAIYATGGTTELKGCGVSGSEKNSIIWGNSGSPEQVSGSATYSCISGGFPGQGNISSSPFFTSGPLGPYYLSQTAAGQSQTSPCVDAGDPATPLFGGTTRTDHVPDSGIIDMGFHYPLQEPPDAGFAGLPRSIDMYDEVYFLNLTEQECDSLLWIFEGGDPATSSQETPVVQYDLPGHFDVTLIAWNSAGADTLIKSNYIQVFYSTVYPVAGFTADKTFLGLEDSVSFQDNTWGVPITWQWEFEGGAPSSSAQQHPVVIYNDTGIFDVQLKVANICGWDSLTKQDYIQVVGYPFLAFQADISLVFPFDTVHFTNLTTNNPAWFQWEFEGGDPPVSSGQDPSVVYSTPGTYDVKLTAGNGYGTDSLIVENMIEVFGGIPVADFSASIQDVGVGDTVWFFDNSGSYPQWWQWEFPGAIQESSTLQNPTVIYKEPGNFDVKLTVGNPNGQNSLIKSNYIEVDSVFDLTLRVYLEGPYNNNQLSNTLNTSGYLPLFQPYSGYPWYYNGQETVTNIPFDYIVDWVLVEFRSSESGPENATASSCFSKKARFINSWGFIKELNGLFHLQCCIDTLRTVYVVLWHRNHGGIMSACPVTKVNNMLDLRFNANKVFGGANTLKEVAPNIWAMRAGDADGTGHITNQDKVDFWNVQSGSSGYWGGDFDMNGEVENTDKVEYWEPNVGSGCQVPQ
mgnify:CR=1 FL=1